MKVCPECGLEKALTEFYVRKSGRPQSYCKACLGVRSAAWSKTNKEKRTQIKREWRERNPGYALNQHLLTRYGITLAEREAMRERQNGRCAICQRHESELVPRQSGGSELHVDHNHETGYVRELLCFTCNLLIGNCQEDPKLLLAAIDYLERHAWSENF